MDSILYQRDVKRMVENATSMLMLLKVQAIACSQCSCVEDIHFLPPTLFASHIVCAMEYNIMEQFSLKRLYGAPTAMQVYWMVSSFASNMWWTPPSVAIQPPQPPRHMSQLHVGRSTSGASGTLMRHGPRNGACLPFRCPCMQ